MRNRVLMTVAVMGVASVIAGAGLALAQSPRGVLTDTDSKFVMEAAEGGQMEVELGQLAQQKASSDAVKQFGLRMVNQHGKAGQELAQLAASKGVKLAKELPRKAQMEMDRLDKAS